MLKLYVAENRYIFSSCEMEMITKHLTPAMRNQFARYTRWQDRQAYALGKHLLVKALMDFGLDPCMIAKVSYSFYKRPHLPVPIDFNISHSGVYVCCAVCSSGLIGVDIEEIRPIDFDDFTSIFTADEWSSIHGSANSLREFFKYWTIKEAVTKADGRGLNFPLDKIKINGNATAEGKLWYLRYVSIDPQYMLHIATECYPPENITAEYVSFTCA